MVMELGAIYMAERATLIGVTTSFNSCNDDE